MKKLLTYAAAGLLAGAALGFTYEDGIPVAYPSYVETDPVASSLVAALTNKVAQSATNFVFTYTASPTNYLAFVSNTGGTAYFSLCLTNGASGSLTPAVNNSNTYFRGRMTSILLTNNIGTYLFFTNTVDAATNWNSATRRYIVPTSGVYAAYCYLSLNTPGAGSPMYLSLVTAEASTTQSVAVTYSTGLANTDIRMTTPATVRLTTGDAIMFSFFHQLGSTRTNGALEAVIYRLCD